MLLYTYIYMVTSGPLLVAGTTKLLTLQKYIDAVYAGLLKQSYGVKNEIKGDPVSLSIWQRGNYFTTINWEIFIKNMRSQIEREGLSRFSETEQMNNHLK